ncbi:MAG: kinase/pyrophosphorylase [Acidobacteria bacterium]|nr:kinase/pyrophosphorylase [Acidobacteriota bacterium]
MSDATGQTCQTVVQAALSQFTSGDITLETVARVRSRDQIEAVLQQAKAQSGVVVFTMVSTELRHMVTEMGMQLGVPTIDILGPILIRFSEMFEISPLAQPGLFRQLDSEYFRRIEAVDYTIKHDDGAGLTTLDQADIVLVGVSRTSKTPVSIYLAYRGCKVANVPLVPARPVPRELLRVPSRRVVALTISPDRLHLIRMERKRRLNHAALDDYIDPAQIRREVGFGNRLYHQQGWPVLDVTYKAIEETAAEVLRLVPDAAADHR